MKNNKLLSPVALYLKDRVKRKQLPNQEKDNKLLIILLAFLTSVLVMLSYVLI